MARISSRKFSPAQKLWVRFWMKFAGLSRLGRWATRLAAWQAPPYKARPFLALLNPRGYIAPSVVLYHDALILGRNVFVDDGVILYQADRGGSLGGPIQLGDRSHIMLESILETGECGSIEIGSGVWIHPRCRLNAYQAAIRIGEGVDIAPNCALYAYDHGLKPNRKIREQPLQTKGDIVIGANAWLGVGVTVLSGVRIGSGAVIGAGSVVNREVPDRAVAVGSPARVIKYRDEILTEKCGEEGDESSSRAAAR
jgi:acetyltransferase-like isoleucine patch superfamily enzyme